VADSTSNPVRTARQSVNSLEIRLVRVAR